MAINKIALNDDQMNLVSGGSKITHRVLPGQTLRIIAGIYNVTVDDLKRWNNIQNENALNVDQPLEIKF